MHLTLLLPGLLLPAVSGEEPYRHVHAPALELVLARAQISVARGGVLAWLAQAFELSGDEPAWAALSLAGDGGEPGAHYWLRADPVHLRVLRDHLALADSGAFAISQAEARAVTDSLNAHFAADGLAFDPLRPDRWYLRLASAPRMRTTPLAEAAGRDVASRLPQGPDALDWHRRLNEIQMLLHALPVNDERESRGELPVNSVWPWGGGTLPQPARPFDAVWSNDPVVAGLARAGGAACHAAPAAPGAALDDEAGRVLVVADSLAPASRYGDFAAWQQALVRVDADGIAPALAALRAGRLAVLDLVLCGDERTLIARLGRGDLRRFWRRPQPLSRLAQA